MKRLYLHSHCMTALSKDARIQLDEGAQREVQSLIQWYNGRRLLIDTQFHRSHHHPVLHPALSAVPALQVSAAVWTGSHYE